MRRSILVGLGALPVLLAGSAAAQVSINAAGASIPGDRSIKSGGRNSKVHASTISRLDRARALTS